MYHNLALGLRATSSTDFSLWLFVRVLGVAITDQVPQAEVCATGDRIDIDLA